MSSPVMGLLSSDIHMCLCSFNKFIELSFICVYVPLIGLLSSDITCVYIPLISLLSSDIHMCLCSFNRFIEL